MTSVLDFTTSTLAQVTTSTPLMNGRNHSSILGQILQNYDIPGCGGILTRDQGSFASPYYPLDYSNNLDCEWVIR